MFLFKKKIYWKHYYKEESVHLQTKLEIKMAEPLQEAEYAPKKLLLNNIFFSGEDLIQ